MTKRFEYIKDGVTDKECKDLRKALPSEVTGTIWRSPMYGHLVDLDSSEPIDFEELGYRGWKSFENK